MTFLSTQHFLLSDIDDKKLSSWIVRKANAVVREKMCRLSVKLNRTVCVCHLMFFFTPQEQIEHCIDGSCWPFEPSIALLRTFYPLGDQAPSLLSEGKVEDSRFYNKRLNNKHDLLIFAPPNLAPMPYFRTIPQTRENAPRCSSRHFIKVRMLW